jgi:hypothetical protein
MYVTQSKHATFTEYHLVTEAVGASRSHLVASNQEASDTVIDVIVDRPVGNQPRAVAEVCAPTAQKPVQLISRTSAHGA